jgi:RNA-directed DNA polymerase
VVSPREEGTPQGGPLSPLLSNILLTDLDQEIEKRGLSFCRYADDCNVYVKTQASGERVMAGLTQFLEKRLKLKVNTAKSAVAKTSQRKFLGYTLSAHAPHIRIATPSLHRMTAKLKVLFRQGRGRSLLATIATLNPVLRGWMGYFRLTQSRTPLEKLDVWIRRRLRCILWRQWKHPRSRALALMGLGLDEVRAWKSAYNGRGPWWNSGALHMRQACSNGFISKLGLLSLVTLCFQRRS